MKNDFKNWFEKKLIISGYPNPKLVLFNNENRFNIIINVSDEFYLNDCNYFVSKGINCYWFPLGQKSKNMGMVSIFGALQVLYKCFDADKSVLLHCRKGRNRSQVVKAAFFYMITKTHLENRNMLLYNCRTNHLPAIEDVEKWLLRCKIAFDNQSKFK